MDKRRLIIVVWLLAILFPLNWLWQLSPGLRRVFDVLIGTEMLHVIAHLFLFGGFAVLLLEGFHLRLDTGTIALLLGGALLIGLGQEALQLQVKGRAFGWPEVFDLGVDLAGAGLGCWAVAWLRRYGRFLRIIYFILRRA